MLTKVTAVNMFGNTLELPIFDNLGPVRVRNIENLDPPKANLSTESYADADELRFQGVSGTARNIVLYLELIPYITEKDVSELRQDIYTLFMTQKNVALIFESDNLETVVINGKVESCEAPMFVQQCVAQISIVCASSYFSSSQATVISGVTGTSKTIAYPGTKPVGFDFSMTFDRAIVSSDVITLTNTYGYDQSLSLTGITASSGQILHINTQAREKTVYVVNGSVATSYLYKLVDGYDWLELYNGQNVFTATINGQPMSWSLSFTSIYGGL